MECKKCKKLIPYREVKFFEEYVALNELYYQTDSNEEKELIIKLLDSLLIKFGYSINDICMCNNIEDKINFIETKTAKIKEKLREKELNNSIIKNDGQMNLILFNIEAIKLLYELLKKEVNKLPNTILLSYNEIKDKISDKENSVDFINYIKKIDILIIYNLLIETDTEKINYIDRKIFDIIEYRYINNKTTYVFIPSVNKTLNNNNFVKIVNSIIDKNLKTFFKTLINDTENVNLYKINFQNIKKQNLKFLSI